MSFPRQKRPLSYNGTVLKTILIISILWNQSSSQQMKPPSRLRTRPPLSIVQCVNFNITEIIRNKINQLRTRHNFPLLAYNHHLHLISKHHAENFAKRGDWYRHQIKGETMYVTDTFDYKKPTDFQAVALWYSERINYHGAFEPARLYKYESYTQMMWRESLDIGCQACNNSKKMYVICTYFPEGNIIDGFRRNVVSPYASSADFHYCCFGTTSKIRFWITSMVFLLRSISCSSSGKL